jgi:hypothetical protein
MSCTRDNIGIVVNSSYSRVSVSPYILNSINNV